MAAVKEVKVHKRKAHFSWGKVKPEHNIPISQPKPTKEKDWGNEIRCITSLACSFTKYS